MDAALRIDTLKNCKDWLAQTKLLDADAGVMHLALTHQHAKRYSGLAMQDQNRIYRALLVPEDVPRKIPASLIMAPTAYQSNRPVDLYIDTQQTAKLISLLDKGVNFERATFVAG